MTEENTYDATAILKKIEDKESIFGEWWSRQDDDEDLYNLEEFTLEDSNDNEYDSAFSYTSPGPKNFAIAMQSALDQAEIIVKVESNEKGFDCSRIEQWVKDFRMSANAWAKRVYHARLDKFNNQHLTLRGAVITRIINQKEDLDDGEGEQLIVDLFPGDPRNTTWEWGRNGGVAWWSYVLEMTEEQALSQYGGTDEKDEQIRTAFTGRDEASVRDYIDDQWHLVFMEREVIIEEEHENGFCPVVATGSGLGSLLLGPKSVIKYWWDSIYTASRALFDFENRIKSVCLSKAMESYRRALVITTAEAKEAADALQVPPKRAGMDGKAEIVIKTLPADAKLTPLYPLEDMGRAEQYIAGAIDEDIQQSQFSDVNYGVYNSSNPPSGALFRQIADERKRIIGHEVEALQDHWQEIIRATIRQWKTLTLTDVKIGLQGKRNSYSHTDLEGEYSIEVEYVVEIPEETIANYMLAEMATKLGLPKDMVFEIAGMQDPKRMSQLAGLQHMRDISEPFDKYMCGVEIVNADVVDKEGIDLVAAAVGVSVDELLAVAQQYGQNMQNAPAIPPEMFNQEMAPKPGQQKQLKPGSQAMKLPRLGQKGKPARPQVQVAA